MGLDGSVWAQKSAAEAVKTNPNPVANNANQLPAAYVQGIQAAKGKYEAQLRTVMDALLASSCSQTDFRRTCAALWTRYCEEVRMVRVDLGQSRLSDTTLLAAVERQLGYVPFEPVFQWSKCFLAFPVQTDEDLEKLVRGGLEIPARGNLTGITLPVSSVRLPRSVYFVESYDSPTLVAGVFALLLGDDAKVEKVVAHTKQAWIPPASGRWGRRVNTIEGFNVTLDRVHVIPQSLIDINGELCLLKNLASCPACNVNTHPATSCPRLTPPPSTTNSAESSDKKSKNNNITTDDEGFQTASGKKAARATRRTPTYTPVALMRNVRDPLPPSKDTLTVTNEKLRAWRQRKGDERRDAATRCRAALDAARAKKEALDADFEALLQSPSAYDTPVSDGEDMSVSDNAKSDAPNLTDQDSSSSDGDSDESSLSDCEKTDAEENNSGFVDAAAVIPTQPDHPDVKMSDPSTKDRARAHATSSDSDDQQRAKQARLGSGLKSTTHQTRLGSVPSTPTGSASRPTPSTPSQTSRTVASPTVRRA
jgi:hypothetical protein